MNIHKGFISTKIKDQCKFGHFLNDSIWQKLKRVPQLSSSTPCWWVKHGLPDKSCVVCFNFQAHTILKVLNCLFYTQMSECSWTHPSRLLTTCSKTKKKLMKTLWNKFNAKIVSVHETKACNCDPCHTYLQPFRYYRPTDAKHTLSCDLLATLSDQSLNIKKSTGQCGFPSLFTPLRLWYHL